jgi:hypothetical protein
MKQLFRLFRFLKYSALSFFVCTTNAAYADSMVDQGFFEAPPLTKREKCEIEKSWPVRKLDGSLDCSDVQLFKPLQLLSSRDERPLQELKISSQTNDQWSFPDLHIKTERTQSHLRISSFSLAGFNYDLSEYIPLETHGYREIGVGNIDNVIILQLHAQNITQLFFIPHQCDDGDVSYTIKQVFSWYPPFQGDSYHKTFFTTPVCI